MTTERDEFVATVYLPVSLKAYKERPAPEGEEKLSKSILLRFVPKTMQEMACANLVEVAKKHGDCPEFQEDLEAYVHYAILDFLGIETYPLDDAGIEALQKEGYQVDLLTPEEYAIKLAEEETNG